MWTTKRDFETTTETNIPGMDDFDNSLFTMVENDRVDTIIAKLGDLDATTKEVCESIVSDMLEQTDEFIVSQLNYVLDCSELPRNAAR